MKEPNSKSNCGIGDEGIKVVVVVGGSFMLRFSKHKTMHCEFSQPNESLFICQVRMLISLVKVISFRIALLCSTWQIKRIRISTNIPHYISLLITPCDFHLCKNAEFSTCLLLRFQKNYGKIQDLGGGTENLQQWHKRKFPGERLANYKMMMVALALV